jgi:hypothetical protein
MAERRVSPGRRSEKEPRPDEEQGPQSPEEREAALPVGMAGRHRGETVKQLIRRAQPASRRKFPAIPVAALETHVGYDVRPRLWASIDWNYL